MKDKSVAQILVTEFSEKFVKGMRDRMMMAYYVYGPVADAYPSKVSALESLRKRLDKYAETGNTEFLMDVGNFAMIEFMHPSHPDAHFKATEASESPGRVVRDRSFSCTNERNDELSDEEWKELKKL